jgi:NAD(P)-dependent dehydrogenase (short-subunit alcohol dehydrogenase family)
MMTARFDGKTAIVTGGGSGIAQAVCLNMAASAAMVTVADIAVEAGRETVSMIKEQGGTAHYVEGDVTAAADCERIVAEAIKTFGRLDILANVAGGSLPQYTVTDLPEEEWRQLLDLNLTSVFLMSKYAVPRIAEAGGGAIVNVSSGAGVSGMPLNPGYVAAKGGVIALTKALALDHAAQQIRVNCVAPGPVLTPLMRRNRTPEEIDGFAALNPLNKVGLPEELADAITYLASDQASFITGQTLNVDGGVNR